MHGRHPGVEARGEPGRERRDAVADPGRGPVLPLEDDLGLCRLGGDESLPGRAIQSLGRHNHEVGTIDAHEPVNLLRPDLSPVAHAVDQVSSGLASSIAL